MTTTKLFKKKIPAQTYDKASQKPVIKASICNGEQIAGFKDLHTGKIEEVMLIKGPADLERFKKMYGIEDEIGKEYWYGEKELRELNEEYRSRENMEVSDVDKVVFKVDGKQDLIYGENLDFTKAYTADYSICN